MRGCDEALFLWFNVAGEGTVGRGWRTCGQRAAASIGCGNITNWPGRALPDLARQYRLVQEQFFGFQSITPAQEWAAEARKRGAEEAERKRLRELEKQAKREARKQVSAPDCNCPRAVLRRARLFCVVGNDLPRTGLYDTSGCNI